MGTLGKTAGFKNKKTEELKDDEIVVGIRGKHDSEVYHNIVSVEWIIARPSPNYY
jgi:hypothetical protein